MSRGDESPSRFARQTIGHEGWMREPERRPCVDGSKLVMIGDRSTRRKCCKGREHVVSATRRLRRCRVKVIVRPPPAAYSDPRRQSAARVLPRASLSPEALDVMEHRSGSTVSKKTQNFRHSRANGRVLRRVTGNCAFVQRPVLYFVYPGWDA